MSLVVLGSGSSLCFSSQAPPSSRVYTLVVCPGCNGPLPLYVTCSKESGQVQCIVTHCATLRGRCALDNRSHAGGMSGHTPTPRQTA